jgi:hypothetical protein
MQHVRLAFVNHRLLSDDEAEALRLRNFVGLPAQEEWRRSLHQAADIIENLGWCRGALRDGTRHCAVGAIIAAFNKGEIPQSGCLESFLLAKPNVQWFIFKVESYLKQSDLMCWNDRRATGSKEVVSVLRAVATTNRYDTLTIQPR